MLQVAHDHWPGWTRPGFSSTPSNLTKNSGDAICTPLLPANVEKRRMLGIRQLGTYIYLSGYFCNGSHGLFHMMMPSANSIRWGIDDLLFIYQLHSRLTKGSWSKWMLRSVFLSVSFLNMESPDTFWDVSLLSIPSPWHGIYMDGIVHHEFGLGDSLWCHMYRGHFATIGGGFWCCCNL